jgi:hypothetical protein
LPKLLNESEKQTALQAFQAWNDALKQKLQPFLESNSEVFITDFFPAAIRPHAAYSVWAKLPKIGSILTNCDLEYSTTTQEFRYDSSQRKWNISENLLYNLSTSTNSSSDLGSSAILFLLHEGLHLHQNLTAETAPRIGQFPKVVEEIDFIADVWAIILADRIQNSNVSDPSLENLITVLIKTLLGFDRDGLSARYFPLRRINRYLIWFWKLLELENLDDKSKGIEIIIQKPILELKGPMIRVNNQRIEMDLKQNDQDLELAFLNGVRIVRHGKSESTQIHDLVEGFRTQDFALIKRSLKSFYDKV